eukprot:Hpha_TRINITY_DN16011_c5_g2::TRINITY_DN16011_c5_g2_i2::g.119652::m.119652
MLISVVSDMTATSVQTGEVLQGPDEHNGQGEEGGNDERVPGVLDALDGEESHDQLDRDDRDSLSAELPDELVGVDLEQEDSKTERVVHASSPEEGGERDRHRDLGLLLSVGLRREQLGGVRSEGSEDEGDVEGVDADTLTKSAQDVAHGVGEDENDHSAGQHQLQRPHPDQHLLLLRVLHGGDVLGDLLLVRVTVVGVVHQHALRELRNPVPARPLPDQRLELLRREALRAPPRLVQLTTEILGEVEVLKHGTDLLRVDGVPALGLLVGVVQLEHLLHEVVEVASLRRLLGTVGVARGVLQHDPAEDSHVGVSTPQGPQQGIEVLTLHRRRLVVEVHVLHHQVRQEEDARRHEPDQGEGTGLRRLVRDAGGEVAGLRVAATVARTTAVHERGDLNNEVSEHGDEHHQTRLLDGTVHRRTRVEVPLAL